MPTVALTFESDSTWLILKTGHLERLHDDLVLVASGATRTGFVQADHLDGLCLVR